MVRLTFNLKTYAGKNLEFLQIIGSIIIDLRKIKGCKSIDIKQSDTIKKEFYLQLNWQNKNLMLALLDKDEFEFFQGAIQVLCEPPIIEIREGEMVLNLDSGKTRNVNLSEQIISELRMTHKQSKPKYRNKKNKITN